MSRKYTLLAWALFAALSVSHAQDDVEKAAPIANSSMGSELFYHLLLSNMSVVSGDIATAYGLMLDSARKENSEQLYERAVSIALQAHAGTEALEAARAWLRANPASPEANRYVLQILVGLNRVTETLEPLKKEIANFPAKDRAAAIRTIPRLYLRVTDKAAAASTVEQALASYLNTPATAAQAWTSVGELRWLAKNPSGAFAAARKGIAANAEAPDPVYLAISLIDNNDPSIEALVKSHLGTKVLPPLRLAYARKLIELNRAPEAYAQTQFVTSKQSAYADAWLLRGSLEYLDKKFPQAENSLKTYLQHVHNVKPDDNGRSVTQAYVLLAQIAEQHKQWSLAQDYLNAITSPQDALLVETRRASILAHQGKLEEARQRIRALPEQGPEDARAKVTAELQLLQDQKQIQLAFDFLESVLPQFPQDAELLYQQAMLADKLGQLDTMERILRSVIAVKPDYHHAYNALGYSLADRNIRLDEARTLINKALEFAPDDAFIVDSLAWLEYRSGNYAEAARLLKKAYASRQDPEIAAHLGEVLWQQGDKAQANSLWNNALKQHDDNDTLRQTVVRLRGKI